MSAAAQDADIGPIEASDLVRVYVWDVVVRVTHWVIAFSILILTITGIYIGNPFLLVRADDAVNHFVMGNMRVIHMYAGLAFTAAVVVRVYWMFMGTRWASFRQYLPLTAQRWREIMQTQLFWMFIKRDGPELIGHNPIGGLMYTAMYGMYFVMVLTGLALWGMTATETWYSGFTVILPWIGGPQGARIIHHVVMWLLWLCVVVHLYSATLVSITERTGAIDSIFSGYKFVRRPRS